MATMVQPHATITESVAEPQPQSLFRARSAILFNKYGMLVGTGDLNSQDAFAISQTLDQSEVLFALPYDEFFLNRVARLDSEHRIDLILDSTPLLISMIGFSFVSKYKSNFNSKLSLGGFSVRVLAPEEAKKITMNNSGPAS